MALVYKDVEVFYGEHDLSGEASEFTPDFAQEIKEHRPFGSASVRKEAGIEMSAGTFRGVLTFSGAGPGNDFVADQGLKVPVSAYVGSASPAAEGDPGFIFNGLNAKLDNPITQGELYQYTLNLSGDGFGALGTVLGNGQKTVTGSGAAQNLGQVAAGQTIIAALHVTAKGGTTPTLDVIIESDDAMGFASPTTRLTFTQIGDAIGYEWQELKSAAGITDTWWRATWTLAGTSPDYTLAVAFAIV